ncbi:MAG: hypothetical protein ACOYN0_17680 [Phycisphaerales bacterium]
MGPFDLAQLAASTLERLGVRYIITGSMASMMYGEIRATSDVDIVVDLRAGHYQPLLEAFDSEEYYISPEAVMQAMRSCGMFNVIHSTSGLKIDFVVTDGTGYDALRLKRAKLIKVGAGGEIRISAPEDVILKKLEFYKAGGSDKHLRDIASMIKISGETFDRAYLESWAIALGVVEEWTAVKSRVGW